VLDRLQQNKRMIIDGGRLRSNTDNRRSVWCVGRCTAGIYCLSVLASDGLSVKHYRIRPLQTGGCYISTQQRFVSVEQLVEHYART